MSRWLRLLSVTMTLSLVLATGASGAGHGTASADITLQGEIVDLACYLTHGGQGPDHQKCAAKCAEMGQPIGLLTADQKLYLLVGDHQDPAAFYKAKELAGQKVELTGEPAEKNGVAALTVHQVKK